MKRKHFVLTSLLTLVVLGAAFAFTKPGRVVPKQSAELIYWFHVDSNGNPTSVIGTDPSLVCPDMEGDLCARAYNESQTTGTGSSRVVISGEELNYTDEAFKEPVK